MIYDEMKECMESLDVERAMEIWRRTFPHLPPITSDEAMLATLHLARTESPISDRLRFYSHCWLTERALPSKLPDRLKPLAERMYPRMMRSVGISLNARSEMTRPIIPIVRGAMEDAVNEVYADGKQDDIELLRRQMREARQRTLRKLLGV